MIATSGSGRPSEVTRPTSRAPRSSSIVALAVFVSSTVTVVLFVRVNPNACTLTSYVPGATSSKKNRPSLARKGFGGDQRRELCGCRTTENSVTALLVSRSTTRPSTRPERGNFSVTPAAGATTSSGSLRAADGPIASAMIVTFPAGTRSVNAPSVTCAETSGGVAVVTLAGMFAGAPSDQTRRPSIVTPRSSAIVIGDDSALSV